MDRDNWFLVLVLVAMVFGLTLASTAMHYRVEIEAIRNENISYINKVRKEVREQTEKQVEQDMAIRGFGKFGLNEYSGQIKFYPGCKKCEKGK